MMKSRDIVERSFLNFLLCKDASVDLKEMSTERIGQVLRPRMKMAPYEKIYEEIYNVFSGIVIDKKLPFHIFHSTVEPRRY